MRIIYGEEVYGKNVDAQTRCEHYNSVLDIIAIKFKCCEQWFPCFKCHSEITSHQPQVWQISQYNTQAILCGGCGHQLSITEYLESESICPKCNSLFNPKCALHYDLYFEALNQPIAIYSYINTAKLLFHFDIY